MRPRKIRERYLFFRDEWPFQDERILINHHIYIYILFPIAHDSAKHQSQVPFRIAQTEAQIRQSIAVVAVDSGN